MQTKHKYKSHAVFIGTSESFHPKTKRTKVKNYSEFLPYAFEKWKLSYVQICLLGEQEHLLQWHHSSVAEIGKIELVFTRERCVCVQFIHQC